jgi:EmrB/QacA subfamily drug resistance transporter
MTAERTSATAAPPRVSRQTGVVMVTLACAVLLAALDQTVVATALPTIAGELGDLTGLSAVVTSYLIAGCVATPIAGKFGDLYGRRPVFGAAVGLFALGSLGAGLAQDITQLVAARAVQGAGGGALMTLAMAVVADSVESRHRARYQGFLGSVFGFASIVGPLVGGAVTDGLSWRYLFLVNVPLCAAVAVAGAATIRSGGRRVGASIDVWGIVMMTASITCTLLALQWAGSRSARSVLMLVAGGLLFAVVFVLVELRVAEPLVPLRLLRRPQFVAPMAVGALTAMSLFTAVTFLPLFYQFVLAADATVSGLLLAPFMATVVVVSTTAGWLVGRWDTYRYFPLAGTALATLGVVSFASIDATTTYLWVAAVMVLFGAGIGMTMQLIVLAAQDAVPQGDLGAGTSMVLLARSIGAAIGVAVFGALFASRYADQLAAITGAPDPRSVTPELLRDLPEAAARAVAGSVEDALRTVFLWAVLPLVLAVLAALGIRDRPAR